MQNKVKQERVRLNMQQQDLAEKIGVSRQTIHSIENNRYTPSTLLALKIAFIFGKSVDELFVLEPADWEEGSR
jgi:putative transcriptional regulator